MELYETEEQQVEALKKWWKEKVNGIQNIYVFDLRIYL